MAKILGKYEKCSLSNLDEKTVINALFNPKEISIDKQVPWTQHKESCEDDPYMEFTGAKPASLSIELFFDAYEEEGERKDVYKSHIMALEELTKAKVGKSNEDKRPPICIFKWGKNFPKFTGVIESLQVKYTMFLHDGTPCRATASIKMTRAERTKAKKRKK